jgi:hypothetical protein
MPALKENEVNVYLPRPIYGPTLSPSTVLIEIVNSAKLTHRTMRDQTAAIHITDPFLHELGIESCSTL